MANRVRRSCAAYPGAESLTQSGGVQEETSGSPDLPGGESQGGPEHVGKAGAVRRRVGRRPATPARYGEGCIASSLSSQWCKGPPVATTSTRNAIGYGAR